jgi:hypothetical protein
VRAERIKWTLLWLDLFVERGNSCPKTELVLAQDVETRNSRRFVIPRISTPTKLYPDVDRLDWTLVVLSVLGDHSHHLGDGVSMHSFQVKYLFFSSLLVPSFSSSNRHLPKEVSQVFKPEQQWLLYPSRSLKPRNAFLAPTRCSQDLSSWKVYKFQRRWMLGEHFPLPLPRSNSHSPHL